MFGFWVSVDFADPARNRSVPLDLRFSSFLIFPLPLLGAGVGAEEVLVVKHLGALPSRVANYPHLQAGDIVVVLGALGGPGTSTTDLGLELDLGEAVAEALHGETNVFPATVQLYVCLSL